MPVNRLVTNAGSNGFPPERLPPLDDDIAIGGIDFQREAGPAHRLCRDQGRTRSAERLVHDIVALAVVHDRPTHRLDRLRLAFLTNNFDLPALTIAQLYKCRWQVELFFKWIKQHLRIKAFFGTSENAVKTQIWIAIAVYVLVAIIKKRLDVPASLYTILQILSLTLFEKTPLDQLLDDIPAKTFDPDISNQMNLFN